MKKKLSAFFWSFFFGLIGFLYLTDESLYYIIMSKVFLAFSVGYFIALVYYIFQEPLDKWWDKLDDDDLIIPLDKWWDKLKKKEKLRLKKKKKM